MKRREFLKLSAQLGAMAFVQMAGISCTGPAKAKEGIELPALPYAENALEPYISASTIGFHHGKHHKGYVDKVNQIVKGTSYAHASLEQIIAQTRGQADTEPLFNNAAQVFNHTFYWNSMKPGGGGRPAGSMAEKIDTAFGGYDKFAEAFSHAAASQFGSGWAWLVKAEDNLKIITTGNASTPAGTDLTPLLTLDVWEHAYYLDYQNRRTEYIKAFLEHLVNWEFAEKNMG